MIDELTEQFLTEMESLFAHYGLRFAFHRLIPHAIRTATSYPSCPLVVYAQLKYDCRWANGEIEFRLNQRGHSLEVLKNIILASDGAGNCNPDIRHRLLRMCQLETTARLEHNEEKEI